MFLCLFFLLECLSPSSLHISAFPHHFLPLFYSICLFGFLPLSFSCSFYFLYLLAFGLCSISIISHSCTALVLNICKGNLPRHKVYLWNPSILAPEWSSWLISAMSFPNISKGQLLRKFTQHSSVFFFQAVLGVWQDCVRAAVPALQGTARLQRTKWLKNTAGSLHVACSRGCAVDWPLNTLHESDLYHRLAILQISLKSKQILKNLCVNCSEKKPGPWIHVGSSCCFQLRCTDIGWCSLAYRAEKTF